jgi:cob(I)alamin adenosyltransferase
MAPSAHSVLRPGIMVSLKTQVTGGVTRSTPVDLPVDPSMVPTERARVIRRETTTVIENPEERERASKVRSEARAMIAKQCINTEFGLLCPEANVDALKAAINAARALTSAYNEQAETTEVYLYVITGHMASNDEENARAITEEVRSLIATMDASIDKLDPEAIRDAASRAKRISAMLSPEASETVGAAVAAARKAARDITRLQEKGTTAAVILKDIQRGAIEQARITFLDFDTSPAAVTGDELPAVDLQRVAGLDLDAAGATETPSEPPAATTHAAPELELTGDTDSDRYEAAASPAAYDAPAIEVAS